MAPFRRGIFIRKHFRDDSCGYIFKHPVFSIISFSSAAVMPTARSPEAQIIPLQY